MEEDLGVTSSAPGASTAAASRSRERPYCCPGCDREAFVWVKRTTLHSYGKGGLVYSISCCKEGQGTLRDQCLGAWFSIRPFPTETSAISEWNQCIIDMGAAALGITSKEARALKERRAVVRYEPRGLSASEAPISAEAVKS